MKKKQQKVKRQFKYISRCENRTRKGSLRRGWQVGVTIHGVFYQHWFGDPTHGNKKKSYKAAEAFVLRLFRELW